MTSKRLEAFSDGLFAIIITIMVLELKPPHEYTLDALIKVLPTFVSYVVSFLYVSIYWISHHHLFTIASKVNGKVLWSNLNLLFWLSFIPFTTSWIGDGDRHADIAPIVLYGVILIICHLAYLQLRNRISKLHGKTSTIGKHLHISKVEIACLSAKVIGLFLAILNTYLSMTIFLLVGLVKALEINHKSKKVFTEVQP